jgi:aspartate/methionine/tyrosine aminotransferase
VDLDHVKRGLSDRTRAVVVVHPNNPTGSYLKRHELTALCALGVPIISDEVFSMYPLVTASNRLPTLLNAPSTLVFTLGGLSKQAGLPQLKLAWTCVSGPASWVAESLTRLELLADTYLSPNTATQEALPEILSASDLSRRSILARLQSNLATLKMSMTEAVPLSLLNVEGGWTAPVRLPRTRSDVEWALSLLAVEEVVVQPGFLYDFEMEAVLVLSLLTPEDEFAEGVARLVRHVCAFS